MKKTKFITLAVLATLVAPFALNTTTASANTTNPITIEMYNPQQKIDGFGCAEAGWVHTLYQMESREEIVNKLFGDDGLKLNILRGEVFPEYSGDGTFGTNADVNIPLDDPLFEKTADNENYLHKEELQKLGQLWLNKYVHQNWPNDKLIYSVWSPPAYMKTNGSTSQGFLKSDMYYEYANWLVQFIQAFKKAGLPTYAISPANEPEGAYFVPWTGCEWLPSSLANFIAEPSIYLGPIKLHEGGFGERLKTAGLNTKIIFGENAQWSDWGLILGAKKYTARMLENKHMTDYPIIAAGHGYVDPLSSTLTSFDPFEAAQEKNVPVWLTEFAGLTEYDGSMDDALDWANQMQQYLKSANTSAVVWWTGAVPGLNQEGLILLDKDNRTGYTVPKRYDTFGNFSRYIPEGATRYGVTQENLPDGVSYSSFVKDGKITIVGVNTSKESVSSPLASSDGKTFANVQSFTTDSTQKWVQSNLSSDSDNYTLTLPAKSVVTWTADIQ